MNNLANSNPIGAAICILFVAQYMFAFWLNYKIYTLADGKEGAAAGIACGIIPIANWILLILAIFMPKRTE